MIKDIPKEVQEIMSYLAHDFARSMKDPVQDEQDLYNDMVVLYLENKQTKKVKDPTDKNQWFVFFKSQMLNKYKKLAAERRGLDRLKKLSRI